MQHKEQCVASTATLLACRSIAQAFSENIFELAHLRKGWDFDYAETLKKRIHAIYTDHFATGKNLIQPEKLEAWRELMISALTDLAVIRASVRVDFKEDKEFLQEFFTQMGYAQYFSDAKNGDHVSLYNFISTFATHLTPELISRVTHAGLDENIVRRIQDDARALVEFKECFESFNNPEVVDTEGRKMLEEVYREIQDISRIATAYYCFDPQKRESFNFFRSLRNLSK